MPFLFSRVFIGGYRESAKRLLAYVDKLHLAAPNLLHGYDDQLEL